MYHKNNQFVKDNVASGLYAYETILSIVKYSQASTIIAKQEILINIFDNGITASCCQNGCIYNKPFRRVAD